MVFPLTGEFAQGFPVIPSQKNRLDFLLKKWLTVSGMGRSTRLNGISDKKDCGFESHLTTF